MPSASLPAIEGGPKGVWCAREGGVGGLDSHEAKTHSKRTKEQVQAKNRNKNNTFQSGTPAGRRINHGQPVGTMNWFPNVMRVWLLTILVGASWWVLPTIILFNIPFLLIECPQCSRPPPQQILGLKPYSLENQTLNLLKVSFLKLFIPVGEISSLFQKPHILMWFSIPQLKQLKTIPNH